MLEWPSAYSICARCELCWSSLARGTAKQMVCCNRMTPDWRVKAVRFMGSAALLEGLSTYVRPWRAAEQRFGLRYASEASVKHVLMHGLYIQLLSNTC